MKDEIKEALDRVLESQRFILGEEVEKFEKEVSSYLEVAHAVGCGSGTDALFLSLMSLDIKKEMKSLLRLIRFLPLLAQ